MSSSVTVLCPNGRRVAVKTAPNTTVLQIIEQACKKQGFAPDEYDLKHLKRTLKADSTVRFESVPNNAQLELVPAEKKRKEEPVTIVLQLPSGTRVQGDYLPNITIQSALEDLRNNNPNEADLMPKEGYDFAVLYIRSEIREESFPSTTLKDLGLTGGKALFRLLTKPKDISSSLVCVGGVLPKPEKQPETPVDVRKSEQTPTARVSPFVETTKAEEPPKEVETSEGAVDLTAISSTPQSNAVANVSQEPVPMDVDSGPGPQATIVHDVLPSEMPEDGSVANTGLLVPETNIGEATSASFVAAEEEAIFPLGEHEALLFHRNEVTNPLRSSMEVEDNFFDVTFDDIKLMHKDLVKKRKELEQESELSLLTEALRQRKQDTLAAHQEADRLARLHRYPKTTLRISFPVPDCLVLQAVFKSVETVDSVIQFVRKFLAKEQRKNLNLYSAPPKQVLDPSIRLFELDLPPGASLYISSDSVESDPAATYWLHEEYRRQVSSFSVAARIAEDVRNTDRKAMPLKTDGGESTHVDQAFAPPSDVLERLRRGEQQSRPSAESVASKLPKWFKK